MLNPLWHYEVVKGLYCVMLTVFQRWLVALSAVAAFALAAAITAVVAAPSLPSDTPSSVEEEAFVSTPAFDDMSAEAVALSSQLEECDMHWRCLGEIGRQAIADGKFTELYQAFAAQPLIPCHALAQDASHAQLNAGVSMEEIMSLVTQHMACQGGYFDGTFGWMGTNGGWEDRARAQSVVGVCSKLENEEMLQACADGAGNGFMQGSASMDDALSLCEMFESEQLVGVCLAQVPQQAFRPTWDKSRPAVHEPAEALDVLEPFCEKVTKLHGPAAQVGCIDGLSHPLSWEADYLTRTADTPGKVKQSNILWDEALEKCRQLKDQSLVPICDRQLGLRAGFATAIDSKVRAQVCDSSRPPEFTRLCKAVTGR